MSKRIWHSGPPPHVGWWNADWYECKDLNAWRWWNGRVWSVICYPHEEAEDVAIQVVNGFVSTALIRWTYYWPKNARVPRINPNGSKK